MRMSWWWLSHFKPRAWKEARAVEEFLERKGAEHRSTAKFLGRRRALRVPSAEAGGGRVGHLASAAVLQPQSSLGDPHG